MIVLYNFIIIFEILHFGISFRIRFTSTPHTSNCTSIVTLVNVFSINQSMHNDRRKSID